MPSPFSPPRWPFLLAAALLFLAGCEKDEIRSYSVPRPVPEEHKVRLLGAIVENGKDQWFFKLLGPIDEVGKYSDAFRQFVESVHFTGKEDPPVEWKVPAGWEKGPAGDPLRYATFLVGPKDKPLPLTIFKFGQQSPLLDNINRWCKLDLGRRSVREAELKEFTKSIRVDGKDAILVEMTGPGTRPGSGGKARPMAGAGPGPRAPRALPITYKTPEGWKETGPRVEETRGIRVPILTAFTIGDPEKKTETTVTSMPDMRVSLLQQVVRWRSQVGLRPISQEELDRDPPQKIRVGGEEAPYFDFKGPEKRMLLVPVKHRGETWYLKLLGNPELVDNNKSKFESFVKSVQFNGAPDE